MVSQAKAGLASLYLHTCLLGTIQLKIGFLPEVAHIKMHAWKIVIILLGPAIVPNLVLLRM